MEGVAAVEDDIAAFGAGQWVWLNQHRRIVGRRVTPLAEFDFITSPKHRQFRQHPADPTIAAGVAEQNEIATFADRRR